MDIEETEVQRKALDRERKRLAKEHQMRGYARQSISVVDKLVGVKKENKK